MNKRIKNMEYVLIVGACIILFALLGFLFSDIENEFLKLTAGLIINAGYFILSYLILKVLKLDYSSKIYYGFGIVSLIINYVFIGAKILLNSWFSFDGNGCSLFLASIFLLIIILSILTKIKYKEFNYIRWIVYSGLLMIYFIILQFTSSSLVGFIVLSLVLLLLNIFEINDEVSGIVKMADYIFVTISLVNLFSYEIILVTILFLLNIISIVYLLNKSKDFESRLFSIIVLSLSIIFYIVSLSEEVELNICLAISTFIICTFDLAIKFGNMLKNKFIECTYKVVVNVILLFLVIASLSNDIMLSVVILFLILITSFVKIYVLRNDDLEKKLFSIKVVFMLYALINYVNSIFVIFDNYMIYIICNIISLLFYNFTKNKELKYGYFISCMGINLLIMFIDNTDVLCYLGCILIFMINYLFFIVKENKIKSIFGKIFYTLLIIVLYTNLEYLEFAYIKYLIYGLVLFGLMYFVRESKYNILITIPLFLISIISYTNNVIEVETLKVIVGSLIIIITVLFTINYLNFDNKLKDTIVSLSSIFNILYVLSINEFATDIYSLVISIIIFILATKNSKYKVSYYVGLIFSIVSMIALLDYLGNIPTSIYLLIIGIFIVILMFILIYRYENNDKETFEVIKYKNIYCPECGKEHKENNQYCGNCGTKLK